MLTNKQGVYKNKQILHNYAIRSVHTSQAIHSLTGAKKKNLTYNTEFSNPTMANLIVKKMKPNREL